MANSTERIGIYECGKIAERNNWLFREQPINDIGIDAHMELIEEGKPKQLLALQIKSGESWFKEKKDGCIIFRDINERQYNYWTMNSLPCILVLYNPTDEMCIWGKLNTETIQKTRNGEGKGYYVKVPCSQIFLDDSSNRKILSYTNLPQHLQNYNFLLSQKKFMEIIESGGEVKLHSTEWVNKSSGKGETKLIVNDGDETKEYLYPYWFPFTPYEEVFPKLFPWANFSVDEEFFEESDSELWQQLHCWYDNEMDDWIVVGDTFEQFRQKLHPMRYVDHAGEVAEYMLVLSLNELGKSFLEVEQFISETRPYTKARPESKDK
ncbi:PF14280 domain protein [Streptococcus sp. AS20]|jgi:hypothetical protein|uniref:DUF4365 domain-containing protein n=1 Tax=Streptococcus sanguinis TaxID=1305 RepID=A0AB74DJ95_STRSA|nr:MULTISPECIES: DUF4365 domain-containing protein [Streptococcus]EUB25700.1 PF14280 domain protein [Streptococcus sp. AS20]RSI30246.1 hypothetical protein D8879_07830 [Streptococcus sanguinis]RSI35659.1 hypothetical protein D8878_06585 [Streptococcus sanguinis]